MKPSIVYGLCMLLLFVMEYLYTFSSRYKKSWPQILISLLIATAFASLLFETGVWIFSKFMNGHFTPVRD